MRMSARCRSIFVFLLVFCGQALASPLSRQMQEVERLRGVPFVHEVTQRTIGRSELRSILRAQIARSVPYSADDYVQVLAALQLIDASKPEILDRLLELYESQVLAFYDPLTHTYFGIRELPQGIAGIGDPEVLRQSVVIHELVHALQDQRFGASVRDLQLQRDTDGQLAYHALLEGEASLVMIGYLMEQAGQSIDDVVKNDLLVNAMSVASAPEKIDPSAPRYFVESLKFPYIEGLKLVIEAYRRGGWKEVDRLHADPPRSTREVLHPAEYFARLGRGDSPPPPFDVLPPPGALTVEHLGEFHWRFLVGDAASGWKDDRVTVLQDAACEPTVLAETQWDTTDDATAFREAYAAFLRGRGIEPFVGTSGNVVRIAYGADGPAARRFVR
jgi:hypothetical protein